MVTLLILLLIATTQLSTQATLDGSHPPAESTIFIDPSIKMWSMGQELYNVWVTNWNGQDKQWDGMVRVDGETFTFMGPKYDSDLTPDATIQSAVKMWPTRTVYEMNDSKGRIKLRVQFTTPVLQGEWEISVRPITYVTFTVVSADGNNHSVQVYFGLKAHLAVIKDCRAEVNWEQFQISNGESAIEVMKVGTVSQNYYDINANNNFAWGYTYVAVPKDNSVSTVIGEVSPIRDQFRNEGTITTTGATNKANLAQDNWDSLNVLWNLTLKVDTTETKHLAVAYDDIYSIQYFGQQFHPYWRRPAANASIETVIQNALDEYNDLMQASEQFDTKLTQDLQLKSGEKYATLAALAYRQTMAATKLVWNDELQIPWVLIKDIINEENINPLDIIVSISPLFLYKDPAYLQLLLLPVLAYANNETGSGAYHYTYLRAHQYFEQDNMPMEDFGNLFIVLAATTKQLGRASTELWYPKYWPVLQNWANYLVMNLSKHGNQLGNSALNDVNQSLKGIIGLGAFAQLCSAVGKGHDRSYYNDLAELFAKQWFRLIGEDDHYKLAYDQNNIRSFKYNLLYDKLLGIGLFPIETTVKEVTYHMGCMKFDWLCLPLLKFLVAN